MQSAVSLRVTRGSNPRHLHHLLTNSIVVNYMNVTCFKCGTPFEKRDGDYNRSEKLGRRHFCSMSCSVAVSNTEHPRHKAENLSASNRLDVFSPFRAHWSCAKRRAAKQKLQFTVTLDDLKLQWDAQSGICPYTGWVMPNPRTTAQFQRATRSPDRASLDRKNCHKGYTPDNVQFVAMIANFAKNTFEDEQLIGFCKAVVAHRVL